jgi:hypothetical protein
MEYFLVFLIMGFVVALISLLWVKAIDDTMKNNPNYKGEDWLNWGDDIDEDDKDQIG